MIRSLHLLALVLCGLLMVSGSSASLLARPPIGARGERGVRQSKINRAGFIVSPEKSVATPNELDKQDRGAPSSSSPSFVSLGIRSSCARKKAATLENEHATSAAARLRGGNTHLGQPPPMLGWRTYDQDPPKEKPPSSPVRTLHNCADGTSANSPGQFAAAKHNIVDDPRSYDHTDSWEDEEEHGMRRIHMDAGGGGGGGRVGSMPSFPRTLPPAKAPLNKKFAWVP